jgi:hypothetical protein
MQLVQAWQALTLEGSPYKSGKTLEYMVDKMNVYSSLTSSGDAEEEGEE